MQQQLEQQLTGNGSGSMPATGTSGSRGHHHQYKNHVRGAASTARPAAFILGRFNKAPELVNGDVLQRQERDLDENAISDVCCQEPEVRDEAGIENDGVEAAEAENLLSRNGAMESSLHNRSLAKAEAEQNPYSESKVREKKMH